MKLLDGTHPKEQFDLLPVVVAHHHIFNPSSVAGLVFPNVVSGCFYRFKISLRYDFACMNLSTKVSLTILTDPGPG
jgi:hypothetical protein